MAVSFESACETVGFARNLHRLGKLCVLEAGHEPLIPPALACAADFQVADRQPVRYCYQVGVEQQSVVLTSGSCVFSSMCRR